MSVLSISFEFSSLASIPLNGKTYVLLGLQRDRNVVATLRLINQREKHRILRIMIGCNNTVTSL